MTSPELHADDLLDKEARGDLSPAEKVRLDRHVEACSVCRFERQVRDDFRLEFAALGKAARGARLPKVHMSPRVRLALLAAAATLVAGAAAAEWETIQRTVFSSAVVEQGLTHTVSSLPAKSLGAKGGATTSPPAPSSAEQMVDPPSVDSIVAVSPAGNEAAKTVTKDPAKGSTSETAQPSIRRAAATAQEVSPEVVQNVEPEAELSAPEPVTADALFAAANEERQRGAYGEAVRLYRDLSQRFPQSAEATTAHAIVGRLLLDRGDPSGALVQFDDYLQSGMTTLGEEASVGRALALQRLGRATEEAEAWTTLLSAYPQSVHASRARSRLAALGNR